MGRFEEYRTRLGNFLDIPQNTFGKTATVEIRGLRNDGGGVLRYT